jgi:hypothetical protein
MCVILAIVETKIRRMLVQGHPEERVHPTPFNRKKLGVVGVTCISALLGSIK